MDPYSTRTEQRRSEQLLRRLRAAELCREAHRIYGQVRLTATLRQIAGFLLRQPAALPCGQELLRGAVPLAPRPHSVEHIPLGLVIGSEGRSQDFDRSFAPTQSHTSRRWLWIAQTWMEGTPLEPVRLIQIGDRYLVRDGHHRVSVARSFGAHSIEAIVEQVFALPVTCPEECVPAGAAA